MRPSRARTLASLCVAGLALLALRPVGPLEAGLDWLLAPARVLAELASPLGDLQGRDLLAADPAQRALRARERADHGRLERGVLRWAEPRDPELAARARHAVRAEVVERPDGELDSIRIRLEDPRAVRGDYPVVSGDAYLGLVHLETSRGDELPDDMLEVRLVTGADARVGAALEADQRGEPCRLVVGGLTPHGEVRLDVHHPSNRGSASGRVVVAERPDALGFARLANGFELGELMRDPVDPDAPSSVRNPLRSVKPGIDYETGLYQVLVLLPPTEPAPRLGRGPDVLDDGQWLPARAFVRGEPSPARVGRKLALGRWHGVRTGAALRSGARLAGRVLRVGVFTCDVSLLADPGLRVPALAVLESAGEPGVEPGVETGVEASVEASAGLHVLGELVSLGAAGPGRVRFRWPATLELDGEQPVRARIWTGSGEAGVPRGLLIGEAQLPPGPGPHELLVTLPEGGVEPKGLALRTLAPGERRP